MKVEAIKETIKETLKQMIENKDIEIEDDDLFYEDLGVDSIVIVQIFLTCQEKYGVMLSDELNLLEPISVNILKNLITTKLKEKGKMIN